MRDLCKFDMGLSIVCIKEYESFKVDRHYRINGMGDLTMNCDSDKSGYGFCVVDGLSRFHYFTESEMYQYFITEEESHQIFLRDQKLNKILSNE